MEENGEDQPTSDYERKRMKRIEANNRVLNEIMNLVNMHNILSYFGNSELQFLQDLTDNVANGESNKTKKVYAICKSTGGGSN